MKKEFVPYELSLELKQLGFDEPCIAYYTADTKQLSLVHGYGSLMFADYVHLSNTVKSVPTPLYSQAFRWFREKYDLFCYVELVGDRLFDYMIIGDFVEEEIDYEDGPFNTHEEAELACLKKLIEIVKTK